MCLFSDFKKKQSRAGIFLKKDFPKDGSPSSMVLAVFLESDFSEMCRHVIAFF